MKNSLQTINNVSLPTKNSVKRILLGQLGSNGDCLHVTTIARQIKSDYPNCHLTWAISSLCRSMIENNPYVDEIWEITAGNWNEIAAAWYWLEQEAEDCLKEGKFDEVFLTQVSPNNYQNYDGTTRVSHYRGYPKPITIPIQNILRLRDDEVKNVRLFAEKHNLLKRSQVILFEYTSNSLQSFVTPDYALSVAQSIVSLVPDCSIILSSHKQINTKDERIIDGSVLSLRENAELTKYCTLFIGCSSGVTQTALSDWAKPLPMIQLLLGATSVYASIAHDLEYWGLPSDQVLEMTDTPSQKLVDCVYTALTKGFSQARNQFYQPIPLNFNFYLDVMRIIVLQKERYLQVMDSILNVVERYGWNEQIKRFVQTELMPKIKIKIQQNQFQEPNTYIKLTQKLNSPQTDTLKNETNYDHKIKIALDISVLGLGIILESARTGIFRVSEYLVKGLIKSEKCQIYLCSSQPNLFEACQTYINQNFLDKNIRLFHISELQYQYIDIYHSTYYPLPNNIYSSTRIVTIYDLIPVLFPEYFNGNSESIVKNSID